MDLEILLLAKIIILQAILVIYFYFNSEGNQLGGVITLTGGTSSLLI